MDLIDQIRTAREADQLTPVSQAALTDASHLGTSVDVHDAIAVDGYNDRIAALLESASNFELLSVYQHSSDALEPPEIDTLVAEIKRRGIRL